MNTDDKPRFLLAAEELARQRGTEAQEILHRNREAARSSGYPGPDCLIPDEIEEFFANPVGMEAERVEHARSCAGCSALLASAGVDPAEIEKLLTEVRAQPQTLARPIPDREESGRPEETESHLGKKVGWALAAIGSVLLARGPILRFARRYSSRSARKVPDPAPPIAAGEM